MKNLEDIKFEKSDFELAQSNVKIKDNALDTPPTTFLKDAFKRFCKNKSSVVAAFIIGMLLFMSFVFPLLSPHDTLEHKEQTELPPKLFDSGFGFWDGTEKVVDVVYNSATQSLASPAYREDCIIEGTFTTTKEGDRFVNSALESAYGGIISFVNDSSKENDFKYMRNGTGFDFSNLDDVVLNIDFSDEQNSTYGVKGSYVISLEYYNDATKTNLQKIELVSKTNSHEDVTINLSSKVTSMVYDAKVVIELQSDIETNSYIFMDEITLSSTSSDQTLVDLLTEISITDANKTALAVASTNEFWEKNGTLNVYKSNIIYASFSYDWYAHKLGEVSKQIDDTVMNRYIANGWVEYDYSVGVDSFKVLNETKCPIVEVHSQQKYTDQYGDYYVIETTQLQYKLLGYDNMPKYLFGTDKTGRDLVTVVFDGLKVSLLLAFIVSAICFAIGIVWGSISGYFGGNVDLFLERIKEFLGGIPSLVVLTLVIIIIGNNFFTFTLALTLTGWMGVAGRTRVQFYRFKGREYVLASRTLGANDGRLIFKHILPNAMGTIITGSILMIPGVIGSETTLAYLGLGLEGSNTLGIIMSNNQSYISNYPMLILFPAFILALIMISFNLFGNGLRDALNPTLKGGE